MDDMHKSGGRILEEPGRGFVSFLGVPVCRDLDSVDAEAAFLGVPRAVPYSAGQRRSAGAPDYIREKSMRFIRAAGEACNFDSEGEQFGLGGLRIVDCGNVYCGPADFKSAAERARLAVAKLLDRGVFPVIFGGDDAVPIPVLKAYERHGPVTVIQVDEHLDFADEVNGVKEGFSSPMRRCSEMPWVRKIIHVGARGFGCGAQVRATAAAGNIIITERDVRREGVQGVLGRINDGEDYFITVDFDGLSPACFPAVSHPEPGGLSFGQTCELFRGLSGKGRVAGAGFFEMVPAHDINGLSGHCAGRLVINLLHAVFGS